MEKLPPLGKAIAQIVLPTFNIYAPLLLDNAQKIKSTNRQSFSYGEHPRQTLDLYKSAEPASGSTKSVFIFLYGGGLIRGDKIVPAFAGGLVYANIGHYFAENLGCTVVIPDYRLISHGAKFPSGGEDLAMAIDWVIQNLAREATKPIDLYIMGNSAGGIHLSTYLFSQEFAQSRDTILSVASNLQLKGAVLLSVPFHFEHAHASRSEDLEAYFGSEITTRCPLGLLKASKASGSINKLRGVSVMVLNGDLDPDDEILIPKADFVGEWLKENPVAHNLTVEMMPGQNHISPTLSLGTDIAAEDDWGRQVIAFIKRASARINE